MKIVIYELYVVAEKGVSGCFVEEHKNHLPKQCVDLISKLLAGDTVFYDCVIKDPRHT